MKTRKIPGAGGSNKPEIIRRMANNERKFLHVPSANIAVCARLRGPVRAGDIRKGIDAAARIHPLLAAKVVMGSPEEAFFTRGDPSAIPLRVCPRESDTQWFDEVVHEHTVPFDPFTAPLSRFVLLSSQEVSDLVIFCQHAISDGTALVLLLRDILAHAYGTAGQSNEISPPMITDLIPKEKTGLVDRFTRGYSMGIINKRWRKDPWFFDHEDLISIHHAFWEKYAYRIVLFELEGDDAEALLAACREQDVTVGSAVTMAFLAAWQDLLEERRLGKPGLPAGDAGSIQVGTEGREGRDSDGSGPGVRLPDYSGKAGEGVREGDDSTPAGTHADREDEAGNSRKYTVVLPYDLRKRLDNPVGNVFCLFVGSVQVRTGYDRERSFWENTRDFHDQTREKIGSREFFGPAAEIECFDPTLMDAFMSYTLYAREIKKDDPRYEKLSAFAAARDNIAHILAERTLTLLPDIITTNLGRAGIPATFGDLQLEKLYFAPSASTSPLVLGGIGTGSSVTFTMNILAEKGFEEERIWMMERVRDRAMKYLGCV